MKVLLENYRNKKGEILKRLKEFEGNKDYFYELCFCILTPQSSAKKAWSCILKLKEMDFQNKSINPEKYINGVRFHVNKSKYLLELKKNYQNILKEIRKSQYPKQLREFLVKNVKGLGYKEASHFLRNIGHKEVSILDRHILKNLKKQKVIKEIPKSMTPKKYCEIEDKFINFSKKVNIPIDHLDLLFWSQETGEIFK